MDPILLPRTGLSAVLKSIMMARTNTKGAAAAVSPRYTEGDEDGESDDCSVGSMDSLVSGVPRNEYDQGLSSGLDKGTLSSSAISMLRSVLGQWRGAGAGAGKGASETVHPPLPPAVQACAIGFLSQLCAHCISQVEDPVRRQQVCVCVCV